MRPVMQACSGADLNDLALENLQRLLDERVVLEIVLVERFRFFLRRRWRNCAGGRRFLSGSRGRARCGLSRFGNGSRRRFPIRRTFGLYKFDLRPGVTEFGQLRLQQGVIAGVIDEPDVMLKFAVKTDREKVL